MATNTTLDQSEIQTLKNPSECLIENIVCKWLETVDTRVLATVPTVGAAPKGSGTGQGNDGVVLLSDFSLLHAAAMFGEPSMLAESIEHRLALQAQRMRGGDGTVEGEAAHGVSSSSSPPPASHSLFADTDTLWIVSGLADFWAGSEDGEHYSAVLMRISRGAMPSSEHRAVEAFLFDSSGERNVTLSARLVRLVTKAIPLVPSLKKWWGGVDCSKGAAIWAWPGSPRQHSAVGCGVFMCGHLETLVRVWAGAGGEGMSFPPLAAAIRASMGRTPTLQLLLQQEDAGGASSIDSLASAAPLSVKAANITIYTSMFYGFFGVGAAFEPAYRKHMLATMGLQ